VKTIFVKLTFLSYHKKKVSIGTIFKLYERKTFLLLYKKTKIADKKSFLFFF